MRVAMIGLRGVPAKYSGVETAVEEIGHRLVEQGHDVTVYCMRGDVEDGAGDYRGMHRVVIPTIRSKNLQMILYSLLATLHAISKRYDVIHLQALGPATMSLPCWLVRQPVVATCHGLDYKREKWGLLARTYIRLGEFLSTHFAGEVIAVSKSLARHYKDVHRRDVAYIPNGSPRSRRVPLGDLAGKFGISAGSYTVFVGRLVECKRVDHLIRAFLSTGTSGKLVIVGDGPPEIVAELRRLAEASDNVVFTGALYGEALAAVFSNASLFVLPSVLEGLPVALIEALAYDLPVVVSDIAENLEVVEDRDGTHRAVVIKADDEQSLEEGLSQSFAKLANGEFVDTGNAAFVARKYDWDRIAQDTLGVYERVGRTFSRVSGTSHPAANKVIR